MRPFLGQKRQQYCSFYYEIAIPDLGRIVKKVGQRRNSFSGTLVVKHCSKHLSPTYKCGEYSTQLQTFGQKFCFVAFSRGYSVDQINVTESGDHARKLKTKNNPPKVYLLLVQLAWTSTVLSWCIVLGCTRYYLLYLDRQFWTRNWTYLVVKVNKGEQNRKQK